MAAPGACRRIAASLLAIGTWHATGEPILAVGGIRAGDGADQHLELHGRHRRHRRHARPCCARSPSACLHRGRSGRGGRLALAAATWASCRSTFPRRGSSSATSAAGRSGFVLAALLVEGARRDASVDACVACGAVAVLGLPARRDADPRRAACCAAERWWQPHAQHRYQRMGAAVTRSHVRVTLGYAAWTLAAIGLMAGLAFRDHAGRVLSMLSWRGIRRCRGLVDAAKERECRGEGAAPNEFMAHPNWASRCRVRRSWSHDLVMVWLSWNGLRLRPLFVLAGTPVGVAPRGRPKMLIVLVAQGLVLWRVGLYRGLWRFASVPGPVEPGEGRACSGVHRHRARPVPLQPPRPACRARCCCCIPSRWSACSARRGCCIASWKEQHARAHATSGRCAC